jgi:hypothetical protein
MLDTNSAPGRGSVEDRIMNDLKSMGDRIYQVLEFIDARQARFSLEAQRLGINLNQLIAAALAGMLREEIEGTKRTQRPRSLRAKTGCAVNAQHIEHAPIAPGSSKP